MLLRFPLLFLLFSEALASKPPIVKSGIKPKRHVGPRGVGTRDHDATRNHDCRHLKIEPQVFIFSLYNSEANVWYGIPDFDLLAQNITVPGLSPLFPQAHCNANGSICQMTLGEGTINAATSATALWTSGCFDLRSTYFLIAGVAGVNPHVLTTGSVALAKYAVQLDLQYEFSDRQVPANDSSGWFPQYANYPDEYNLRDYPGSLYGTEVFELNDNLKKRAVQAAKRAILNDTTAAQTYRETYGYAPANQPPSVVECSSGTSNNYWSGSALGDAFSAYTLLLTNGSGTYCATQQEDSAILESLLRGQLASSVDFYRVILMRTASDFDRAPPGETEVFHLLYADQQGYPACINNIYLAGIEIIKDILNNWGGAYQHGIDATNYVGDVFNSLSSPISPDIGTPSIWINGTNQADITIDQ